MRWRIAEIFGPTIQGEGELIGTPCVFIRFGGCDFRCPPCDSPHAVLPHLVAQLEHMTEEEIVARVHELDPDCRWVVFSGGNPALFQLTDLVKKLHSEGINIMLETQGSIYHSWIADLESVCVSPKGPGMSGKFTQLFPGKFVQAYRDDAGRNLYFKVVCFDEKDFLYARELHRSFRDVPLFLSVGNHDPGPTVGNGGVGEAGQADIAHLLQRLRWLAERTANDPEMKGVRVLPQMHVLVWGNERGR